MNLFLESIYRLSNIKRFSTHVVNHSQFVSMHTHNVVFICKYIFDCDKPSNCDELLLLKKGLFHDFPESVCGDIAAPIKSKNEEIKKQIHAIEEEAMKEVLVDLSTSQKEEYTDLSINCKTGVEGEIVALADIIDRMIYLYIELSSGNSLTTGMYSDTLSLLKTKKFKDLLRKYPTASDLIMYYVSKVRK